MLDNLDLIIEAGIDLIVALALGLAEAIPKLLEKIPEIITKLVTKLTEPAMLGKLISAALILIGALAGGLIRAIPSILGAIPQIISSIQKSFEDFDWGKLGKNILEGLLNGLLNIGNSVINAVSKVGNSIMDSFKNFFGIHSPSTLMRDKIGKFIPAGVGVGIEANTDSAIKAIDNMNNEIMSEMNKAVNMETGSINANASIKSNNSMLNVIKATFNIDGSVDIDGQKTGRIITPYVVQTLKVGGIE